MAPSLKRSREDDSEEELFSHDPKSLKYGSSWQTVPGTVPDYATDLDQTLRFRDAALTPVDSSDDEDKHEVIMGTSPAKSVHGNRPPALQLSPSSAAKHLAVLAGGDQLSPWLVTGHHLHSTQPSPIPHGMVSHSLNLCATHSVRSTTTYFPPQPIASQPPDANMMDVSFHKEVQHSVHRVRLPSPVSDGDAEMANGPKTPTDEMDMSYSQQTSPVQGFRPSTPPMGQYSRQTVEDLMQQAAKITPTQRKKPALVMGYRADCEKCRCHVPGHYSHIMRA
ncbi:hypothetical protein N7448_008175 [Penicillium atrosanguineum]|uniref:Uncharacterized protein n=1 Tax=Penicillium atrosanguineum TaxID=1132637 RepID=A0A9W9UC27_9EURO|nr:uncharacterized protein N7443_000811 [Penicillium atrosanguineum]KAJ5127396.1 hypothetical protein N7448_008175 [Penicillium atrosanguineum]KAJ5313927.1 hypothetical protein N7443_000811 [Penicillium atrosanguineum]KAJ5331097.1 hypothetical protein N7476_000880 [Penicillium atrosanguineum]